MGGEDQWELSAILFVCAVCLCKLQGEIDKVLKKLQEGVDVFDSIWNKVYVLDILFELA